MPITDLQRAQMLVNGEKSADDETHDPFPVVKLFTTDASCVWLLTELDPEDPDVAFGLCDLGLGFPELGTVRPSEIESVRQAGPAGRARLWLRGGKADQQVCRACHERRLHQGVNAFADFGGRSGIRRFGMLRFNNGEPTASGTPHLRPVLAESRPAALGSRTSRSSHLPLESQHPNS